MILEKAIEILELNLKEAGKSMPPDVKEALELAISDMKKAHQYEVRRAQCK